jgi:uncharacterized Tic20 family protein
MVGMRRQHAPMLKRGRELEWQFLSSPGDRCYGPDAMNDPDMPPPPPTADPSGAPPPQASPVPDPNAPPQQPALTGGVSSEERTWAMIAHLSALAGWLTGGIGNIAGPLIVWLVKKDTMPFAASEAKEALNFNISWLLWFLILCAVTVPLMLLFIGLLLTASSNDAALFSASRSVKIAGWKQGFAML